MTDEAWPSRIWFGSTPADRAARALCSPLSALYGAAMTVRGALYDARLLPASAGPIPAASIGNLTMGGTGKTPIAAWFAGELAARGAHPAIVLRDYGGDESLVHVSLNPGVRVIADRDRAAGVARAAAAGADVAVLDDAFQHRRAARVVDIVLVSADGWPARVRLLPAGPFREPLGALRRASLVVVTRKAADQDAAARVAHAVAAASPGVSRALMHLRLGALSRGGAVPLTRALSTLSGTRLVAISGIGDPGAFARQLTAHAANVRSRAFRDHHAFTAADATRLAANVEADELPVCTLKDFVKLEALWPRQAPPLWYVSQQPVVEEGREALDAALAALLHARSQHS